MMTMTNLKYLLLLVQTCWLKFSKWMATLVGKSSNQLAASDPLKTSLQPTLWLDQGQANLLVGIDPATKDCYMSIHRLDLSSDQLMVLFCIKNKSWKSQEYLLTLMMQNRTTSRKQSNTSDTKYGKAL